MLLRRPNPAAPLALLVPALLAAACGAGAEPASSAGATEPAAPRLPPPAGAAPLDPRVAEIRRALEAGLPDVAWSLLDRLEGSLGVDGPLLAARAALLEGDAVGALREVEHARELAGELPDGRVLALEVEVLVVLDRLEEAREVLREAWKAAGRCAPLERARGILLLRSPGGASEGLAALEAARELDPELPFCDFPLSQGHLVAGREALGEGAPDRALVHARTSRELDPRSRDARELEAEARAALLDFEGALELYVGLQAEGRELGATVALLRQRQGTFLLIEGRRDEAIEAYARARADGLDDEGLGFGAELLAQEAVSRVDAGVERFEAGDLEGATERFREALDLDPRSLEARHHLGVALFRAGDPGGAAQAWAQVLERAGREGIALPDPVHLNLARACRAAGDAGRARAVLERYLDTEPEGRWSEDTRDLLALLELEELGGSQAPADDPPEARADDGPEARADDGPEARADDDPETSGRRWPGGSGRR